jgi:hypothetical protein
MHTLKYSPGKGLPNMGLGRKLREAIYFETVKLVTVRNIKLGVIHKLLQFLVVVYVCVFAIWWKGGTLCFFEQ